MKIAADYRPGSGSFRWKSLGGAVQYSSGGFRKHSVLLILVSVLLVTGSPGFFFPRKFTVRGASSGVVLFPRPGFYQAECTRRTDRAALN